MLLTSAAPIWKLIFALAVSFSVALIVYIHIRQIVPGAELVSAVLFLLIYAAVVRRLTV